ncbi:MAG: TIGR02996 domain-containing protein [Gemmataceae bacterium]|nr:TIGR02996 domain-containing protein [Gemmataceae bacterium]
MTDDDFLRAVAASPDDDTPRLVYADWLDEAGDDAGRARAELIRAQCELERDPPPGRRKELGARVEQLLKTLRKSWPKPLPSGRQPKVEFRRGFPEQVTMSALWFVGAAPVLFHRVPTLRAGRFPNASNEVRGPLGLAGCPHLARLAEVDLHDMCSCGRCRIGDELRELFVSPHVANLSALNVAGDRLDAAAVRVLAESPHLGRLRSLGLAGNAVGPAGGRVLAGSPLGGGLARLDLSNNRLGDVGGRAFAAADRPGPWGLLDLRGNGIGPAVAKRLRERFGKAVRV